MLLNITVVSEGFEWKIGVDIYLTSLVCMARFECVLLVCGKFHFIINPFKTDLFSEIM